MLILFALWAFYFYLGVVKYGPAITHEYLKGREEENHPNLHFFVWAGIGLTLLSPPPGLFIDFVKRFGCKEDLEANALKNFKSLLEDLEEHVSPVSYYREKDRLER